MSESSTVAGAAAPTAAADPTERQLTTQGRERKQQLVECAAQLFAERGFAETRIKDIVDAAGVAKGLFYWYFENKEALFAEVAADIRLRLRKHQAAAIDPDADPLRQLRQGAQASVHFMAENAHFFSLLEVETGAVTEESRREGTAQHVRDSRRIIVQGQQQGLIVDEDPDLLAFGVVGTVGYFSHYHRTGRTSLGIDELSAFVARAVVRSLAIDDEAEAAALRD
ncbi:MAG TPA: TetR family transcriptional regulator [Acidimicrobiales bacterium]|nr:TetR family transcriptional regulator [Acidimicrobiales bacterium]